MENGILKGLGVALMIMAMRGISNPFKKLSEKKSPSILVRLYTSASPPYTHTLLS